MIGNGAQQRIHKDGEVLLQLTQATAGRQGQKDAKAPMVLTCCARLSRVSISGRVHLQQ